VGTGLESFDAFGWDRLLAGRRILLVDRDRARALARAAALDEAGAVTTVAHRPAEALDRARRGDFAAALLVLDPGDDLGVLAQGLGERPIAVTVLARPGAGRDRIVELLPAARLLDQAIPERDLVLALAGSRDE